MKRTKNVTEDAKKQTLGKPKERWTEKQKERISQEELSFERHFVIGCIESDEFCAWARENFPAEYLEARSARKLMLKIYDFFDNYENKAPGRNIEQMIYSADSGFNQEEVMDAEDILESLSREAEQSEDFNFSYLKARAKRQKQKNELTRRTEEARALLKNNQLEDAFEVLQVNEKDVDTSLHHKVSSLLTTSTEFTDKEIPKPKRYLVPWLVEGSLTMVYGPRGVGKTWLCLIIAIALTRQKEDNEIFIGPWEVKRPTGVLYLDAEMSEWQLQDNIKRLSNPLPEEDPANPLHIMSANAIVREQEIQPNLAKKEWRDAIYRILKDNRNIRVLVLDNASALTPGIVENVKEEWDPINQWMISLRHLGVSTILVHHAGKGGQQRGTSGREDAMDTILKVDYPANYSDEDFAWFEVKFEKSRMLRPGDSKKSFSLRIIGEGDEGLTWQEEQAASVTSKNQKKQIIAELCRGRKQKEVAKMYGVSEASITGIKKAAIRDEYLDRKGKPTKAGLDLAEEYKEDAGEATGI